MSQKTDKLVFEKEYPGFSFSVMRHHIIFETSGGTMPTCNHCGSEYSENSRFCPNCGANTATETPEPQLAQTSIPQTDKKAAPKDKPFYKRKWFIVVVIILVLGIIGSFGSGGESQTSGSSSNASSSQVASETVDKSTLQAVYDQYMNFDPDTLAKYTQESQAGLATALSEAKAVIDKEDASESEIKKAYDNIFDAVKNLKEPEVSTEFKNALKKAQSYSDNMHMSKAGIYDQLISSYGEGFPEDAAQYAIDHVKADWNQNALAKAKSYYKNMNMSKSAVYDQLISQYGEQFTEEEAQYAVDHLDD